MENSVLKTETEKSFENADYMGIDNIDDLDKRLERHNAFWNCSITDRPLTLMSFPKDGTPISSAKTREQWLDVDYLVNNALERISSTEYMGDSIPSINPNLGPDFMAAIMGAELTFSETTSWAEHIIEDWESDIGKINFSKDNFYWKKMNEITEGLLEDGKNKFYTGITDMHPAADTISAFRGPMNINMDMIDCPETIKDMSEKLTDIYIEVYDHFYNILRKKGQLITAWHGLFGTKKIYVPSNDFSCMISTAMFEDIFLPSLIREIDHLDYSIYHLDGPDALKHLDTLLDIPNLNAIQWVYGDGHGPASNWIETYQKIQAAGKGICVTARKEELDIFIKNLKPEGVQLFVIDVKNTEEANEVLKKVNRWK